MNHLTLPWYVMESVFGDFGWGYLASDDVPRDLWDFENLDEIV